MIARSEDYVEYCREVAQGIRDVGDLALRGKNTSEITRRVNAGIIREVGLTPADDLVDVGCGDGTLLRLAHESGVANAIGLLATEEEAALVRRRGLEVRQGFTHSLPVADACASVVVCNNVLLVVPRERIPESLREIERIARPGARVYLGEIPFVPGPPPEPEFETVRETLTYLFGEYGTRAALGMARRMIFWKLTGKPMIIRSGSSVSFYAEPSEFVAMAEEAGLELVRYWPHDWPEGRFNYLFRKPSDFDHDAFDVKDDPGSELELTSVSRLSAAEVRNSAVSPW
ncbi:MAG: methyltransferase domain-containing protein [Acidobacteria bacterium]|nr:methyltransferase domain-containing protein [Acidobacteriota bacterium]